VGVCRRRLSHRPTDGFLAGGVPTQNRYMEAGFDVRVSSAGTALEVDSLLLRARTASRSAAILSAGAARRDKMQRQSQRRPPGRPHVFCGRSSAGSRITALADMGSAEADCAEPSRARRRRVYRVTLSQCNPSAVCSPYDMLRLWLPSMRAGSAWDGWAGCRRSRRPVGSSTAATAATGANRDGTARVWIPPTPALLTRASRHGQRAPLSLSLADSTRCPQRS
jgi:hypothetical protein